MAPAKAAARKVSQQAFDEMVQENIDDLGMDPAEALNDAIQTLTLQGVDLSGLYLRLHSDLFTSCTATFIILFLFSFSFFSRYCDLRSGRKQPGDGVFGAIERG